MGRGVFSYFVLTAVIVGLCGMLGIWSIHGVSGKAPDIMKERISQERLVAQMKTDLAGCRLHLIEAAMAENGTNGFVTPKRAYEEESKRLFTNCDILLKGNAKSGIGPAQGGSRLESAAIAVKSGVAEFTAVGEMILLRKAELAAMGDERLGRLIRDDLSSSANKVGAGIDDLLSLMDERSDQAIQDISTAPQRMRNGFALGAIAASLLALILGFMATAELKRRVRVIAESMNVASGGEVTVKAVAESNDELGELNANFNAMAGRLATVVGKVNQSAEELAGISNNLSETARQVVAGAQRQADGVIGASSAMTQINATLKGVTHGVDGLSLSAAESSSSILEMAASIEEVALNVVTLSQAVDEVSSSIVEMATSVKEIDASVTSLTETIATTASSVMEMDSSIRQVEKNAMDTATISEGVRRDAETGKEAVVATTAGIREIKRSSGITYEVINTLSDRAGEIGTILSVIDEVAEQTNLLALNAAIIAAQAGERGKGFAVVADEIKELAERTSSSTREIAQVIKGVQDETRRAVEAIIQAEKSIADGELLSQKSGEALAKIVTGVEKASVRMEEIARTTVEQAKGSDMIRNAMEHVLEMVTQIAMATREQGLGGELIMAAVEKMKELTAQVSSSTREQTKVGNFIAKSTENITGMIQQIKRACDEQSKGSEQIVLAVEDIKHSTTSNLEAANVMSDEAGKLFNKIENVRKEMGAVRIS
ncbi:MAG TPA: methyl-accepting chemotaxis protein [Geobacteraceae bacterium]